MSDRDKSMDESEQELERLRRRVAELESREAGMRGDGELEIKDQVIRSSINGSPYQTPAARRRNDIPHLG